MSSRERVNMIRDAIKAKKSEANRAMQAGKLLEFTNLLFDLGALERCLEIETDMLIAEQEMTDRAWSKVA
jgi:hypothetical protein